MPALTPLPIPGVEALVAGDDALPELAEPEFGDSVTSGGINSGGRLSALAAWFNVDETHISETKDAKRMDLEPDFE